MPEEEKEKKREGGGERKVESGINSPWPKAVKTLGADANAISCNNPIKIHFRQLNMFWMLAVCRFYVLCTGRKNVGLDCQSF